MSELDKAYIDYEPLYDTVDWYSVDIHDFGKDYIYTESDIPIESIKDNEDKTY